MKELMAELRRESPDAHRVNLGGPDISGAKHATPRALEIMNEITAVFAGKNLEGLEIDFDTGRLVYRKGNIELHSYVEQPEAALSAWEELKRVAPDYAAWLEADTRIRGPEPALSEEGRRVLERLMEIAG